MKKIYLHLLILFFFTLVSLLLSSYIGFERHWSSTYDQELTLSYNALLFNNGLKLEYLDHPGYFTILLLSLIIKFLSIFDLVTIEKISQINNLNFDESFQEIIIITRIYSSIILSVFIFINYFLFYRLSKNKIGSFFLASLIFIAPGTIFHFTGLRTELIAMAFILISLICLKEFFNNEKFRYFFLLGFFTFMFCAILNKMQVFFLYPFFLIIFYQSDNKFKNFDIKNFYFLNHKLIPLVIFLLIIFYIYLPNNTLHPFPYLSGFAIIFYLFILNLFFYFVLRSQNQLIKINLIVINLTLITTYFVIKNFLLIHPSTNPIIFTNITRIMHLTQYIHESPQVDDAINTLYFLFSKFFVFALKIFQNIILKINYYSILILLNVLLMLAYKSSMTKKMVLFNLICLITSIFLIILNSYRLDGNILPQYYLFSDLFLIISYLNFIKFIKIYLFILIFIISFSSTIKTNYDMIISKKITENKINDLCNGPYFYDWHQKINSDFFENFCKKNSF